MMINFTFLDNEFKKSFSDRFNHVFKDSNNRLDQH